MIDQFAAVRGYTRGVNARVAKYTTSLSCRSRDAGIVEQKERASERENRLSGET